MRKFLTVLVFVLVANAVLDAAPAVAETLTLPVYGRDRNAVADATITFNPIGAFRAIADVDGDGRNDLLYFGTVFDFATQTNPAVPILAYHNLGGGNFELVEADQLIGGAVPNGKNIFRLLTAELNGDGKLDVVVGRSGDDFSPFSGETNLLLLSGPTGGLALTTSGFPQFSDFTHDVAVGDIDGDGDNDIFLANICCGEIGPYFLMNNGSGSFTFNQTRLPNLFLDQSQKTVMAAKIVDVNADSHVDLVMGLLKDTRPGAVLLNDGTGDYSGSAPIEFPKGVFANGLTPEMLVIDVNEDGFMDLILSETDGNNAGARVQVLIGNGDGSFRDESFRFPTDFPFVPGGPDLYIDRLEAINFNDDGHPDVLVQLADGGTAKTTIWVNNGSGFFKEIPDNLIPDTPTFETFGILDGLPLLPIANATGRLDFIGPEFQCIQAGAGGGCALWKVVTSVYRPTGSAVVILNFGPGAFDDGYSVRMNRTLEVSAAAGVLANDIEPDGEPMTVSLVGQPGNGTVTLNADGSFTYEPDRSFIGTDSFTYKTSDGDLESNVATVTVTVEAIAKPWLMLLLDD